MIFRVFLLIFCAVLPAMGEVVVDQAGREVVIPEEVERVVSLHEGPTWITYTLGAADVLVGAYFVSLPTDPLAQEALAQIDPSYRAKEFPIKPTLEAIVALGPDVVFASPVVHGEAFADLLAQAGIPTVFYYPETLEAVEEAFILTGKVLGREERAGELARRFREIIEGVKGATQTVADRPRVYFAAYYALNVYAGPVIQNVLVELAGGVPLGRGLSPRPGAYWLRVDPEQIILWDPEVILVPSYSHATPADFLTDPVFAGTSAARAGRVYRFPGFFSPWDVPGPEVVLGLLWLTETLHPGATGADLVAEVAQFYKEFYGCNLQESELAQFLGR